MRFRDAVHVSQEGLIEAATPYRFAHIYRPVYREAEDAIARAGRRAGHTAIIGRTNRTRAHRERRLQAARDESCSAVALMMTIGSAAADELNAKSALSEDRMEGRTSRRRRH